MTRLHAHATTSTTPPRRLSTDEELDAVATRLVERYRNTRDVAQLAELFTTVRARLERMARAIAARIDGCDPDDLVGRLMVTLLERGRDGKLPPITRFLTFAYVTMRHDAWNTARGQARERRRLAAWAPEESVLDDPRRVAERREAAAEVPRVALCMLSVASVSLAELSARERELLQAREVEGLSYRALARRFDLPEGHVGSTLRRARLRLAERLRADLRTDPGRGRWRRTA